jgi:hypothetical protein
MLSEVILKKKWTVEGKKLWLVVKKLWLVVGEDFQI